MKKTKDPAASNIPQDISEAEALQNLINAHNAESRAIIEYIRAHNRAAMERANARKEGK